jgi:hypothetical protein
MNQQTKPTTARKTASGQRLAVPPTSEAQRRAAVILEVLAGLRSAPQAGAALKISVNHYYLLERQALQGLVTACEPRPKGQRVDQQRQLRALEQALERSQRDCQRQAALVRATQRAVGLPATPPPEHAAGKPRRGKNGKSAPRRRTTAIRALRMAHRLSQESLAQDEAAAVQPIAGGGDSPLSAEQEHDNGTGGA